MPEEILMLKVIQGQSDDPREDKEDREKNPEKGNFEIGVIPAWVLRIEMVGHD